jgi:hypothetical protein
MTTTPNQQLPGGGCRMDVNPPSSSRMSVPSLTNEGTTNDNQSRPPPPMNSRVPFFFLAKAAHPRTHSHCSSSSFSPNLQIDDKQVQGESVPPRSRSHLAILCHSTMTELSVLYRSCSEMIEKLQPIFEISNKFSQQRSIGVNTPGTKPKRNNKYIIIYK